MSESFIERRISCYSQFSKESVDKREFPKSRLVTELFRGVLSVEDFEEFDKTITVQKVRAGHVFYSPGDTGEVLYMLKKGIVQLYRMSPDGRKLVITHLPRYSFFGEMSLVGEGMQNAYAEAVEDSVICTMRRGDVERLVLAHPRVGLRLLETVAERLRIAEQQLEALAFKGLVPRVAELLVNEANGDEVRGLSHQDIAERLGVYRESATNALKVLKNKGLIKIGRRRLTITNRRRLEFAAAD